MSKTVLITGSSRGIGRAAALRYAKEKYNIVLNCKNSTARMDEVLREVSALVAP